MTGRLVCVIAIVATTGQTRGDSLGTAREQPLREIAHTVDIRVADGVATCVVQRRFENRGSQADEVRLSIDLPSGAAATGLRIRAKHLWHSGELLERNLAAERYAELTGRGVFTAKDPALLYWETASELFLQLFPVMPKSVSTVEYTLTVPVEYSGGRYHITYPKAHQLAEGDGGIQLVDPVIAISSATSVVVDGKLVRSRGPLPTYDGIATEVTADTDPDVADPRLSTLAAIAIPPPAMRTWQARLGRVVASDRHAFTRLELDAAPQLSALPRGAQVVFVVDASHSAGPELVDAQLAIARAYARHVPDAHVELVVYRRTAKRVFGTFVPTAKLAAAIDAAARRGAFTPGNGSALDEGARLAAGALATRSGPRRIVLLTDELVRDSLSADGALQSLATLDAATVVHVVSPVTDAGDRALRRDDAAALAPLATRHHGIFARLPMIGGDAELATTVLELVRPIRIDHLALTSDPDPTDPLTIADTLREGEGIRLFAARDPNAAPTKLGFAGKLWSDPITLTVHESATFSRASAAFVFGAGLHSDLTDAEMMTVARAGRAVSPVTSYLAIEPGVRPSTIGLEGGGTGWGTLGSGRYGSIGHGSGTGTYLLRPDLAAMIDTTACVQAHSPADGWTVKLDVATTRDEIVDIHVRNGAGALATCLVETAWQVRLDSRFSNERDSFTVDLR